MSDPRKASTNRITGIVITTPSVASDPHWSFLYPAVKLIMATEPVRALKLVTISGKRNSFQLKMKLRMNAASIPGPDSGRMILAMIAGSEAPSSAALSVSSRGISSRKVRSTQIPLAIWVRRTCLDEIPLAIWVLRTFALRELAGNLVEEGAQHPDRQGDLEPGEQDDERQPGVDEPQRLEHQLDRDQRGDRREHAGDQDHEEQQRFPPELQETERQGREPPEEQRAGRSQGGRDQA